MLAVAGGLHFADGGGFLAGVQLAHGGAVVLVGHGGLGGEVLGGVLGLGEFVVEELSELLELLIAWEG